MTDEARKALADELKTQAERLRDHIGHAVPDLMVRAATALRSQPGPLAREEVARIIRKHVRMLKDGDDASQIAVSVDAILALTR